jgi:hypothetical protein
MGLENKELVIGIEVACFRAGVRFRTRFALHELLIAQGLGRKDSGG